MNVRDQSEGITWVWEVTCYYVSFRGHRDTMWKSKATWRFICECQRPQSGFYVSIKVRVREAFESDQGKLLCDCHGNSECIIWVSEDTGYYVRVKDHSENIVCQKEQWGFYINVWGHTDDIIWVSEARQCLLNVRGLREDTQWVTVVTVVTWRILCVSGKSDGIMWVSEATVRELC